MRGTAPLLVALAAALTVGETLSPLSWAGVLGVSAACWRLGLSRHALSRRRRWASRWPTPVVIAVYTVVDGSACAPAATPLQYVVALFLLNGWPFARWCWHGAAGAAPGPTRGARAGGAGRRLPPRSGPTASRCGR